MYAAKVVHGCVEIASESPSSRGSSNTSFFAHIRPLAKEVPRSSHIAQIPFWEQAEDKSFSFTKDLKLTDIAIGDWGDYGAFEGPSQINDVKVRYTLQLGLIHVNRSDTIPNRAVPRPS